MLNFKACLRSIPTIEAQSPSTLKEIVLVVLAVDNVVE